MKKITIVSVILMILLIGLVSGVGIKKYKESKKLEDLGVKNSSINAIKNKSKVNATTDINISITDVECYNASCKVIFNRKGVIDLEYFFPETYCSKYDENGTCTKIKTKTKKQKDDEIEEYLRGRLDQYGDVITKRMLKVK